MFRGPTIFGLVGACLILDACHAPAQDIDSGCLDQLLKEGAPAWRATAEMLDDVEVSWTDTRVITTLNARGREEQSHQYFERMLSWDAGRRLRMLEIRHPDIKTTNRRVVNDRYGFIVAQVRGQKEHQLASCNLPERGIDELVKSMSSLRSAYSIISSGIAVIEIPLETMISDADQFQLVTAKYVGSEPSRERLILVESRYLGPQARFRREGGLYWAEVSDDSWMIQRSGIRRPGVDEQVIEITYQPWDEGLFPKLIRNSNTWVATGKEVHQYVFEAPTQSKLADAEFYLPAYGISETVLETLEPRPLWQFWIWAAGFFVLLAVYVAVRRSRRTVA